MRWVLRGISRVCMLAAVIVAIPTVFSLASALATASLPTLDAVTAVGVAALLLGLAAGAWWGANRIEDERRRRASEGGIDRNPRRGF